MARPRFKVDEHKRSTVRALAGYGLGHEQIAHVIGVRSPKTLRKHFRLELTAGSAEANAQVAQTAFRMATSGKYPAATIFWLKTRARWSERPQETLRTAAAPTLIIDREVDSDTCPD